MDMCPSLSHLGTPLRPLPSWCAIQIPPKSIQTQTRPITDWLWVLSKFLQRTESIQAFSQLLIMKTYSMKVTVKVHKPWNLIQVHMLSYCIPLVRLLCRVYLPLHSNACRFNQFAKTYQIYPSEFFAMGSSTLWAIVLTPLSLNRFYRLWWRWSLR